MQSARIVYRQTRDLRHSDYYRNLIFGDAAKEMRIFGLRTWMIGRFVEHFLDAMSKVWKERAEADRWLWWGIPLRALIYTGALVIIVLDGVYGRLSLARVTVLISALSGASAADFATLSVVVHPVSAEWLNTRYRTERGRIVEEENSSVECGATSTRHSARC